MILIAAYRGTSLLSRLICWFTRSRYSHIGILFTDDLLVRGLQPRNSWGVRSVQIESGNVIEAWKGGVKLSESLSERHARGTVVDLFEFAEPLLGTDEYLAAHFLCSHLGKPYDYTGILLFLTRQREDKWEHSSKWFCSKLAFAAFLKAQRPILLRTEPYRVPPDWIPRSPLLKFHSRFVCGKGISAAAKA